MTLIPTEITFHGLATSDAFEAAIRERVAWLERFYSGIVGCRVVVERPHRHHRDGRRFQIRIEVTIPDRDPIIVSHHPSLHGRLTDEEEAAHHKATESDSVHRYAAVAVRQAFDVMRRRLEDAARVQRGAVKTHEAPRRPAGSTPVQATSRRR